MQFRLVAGKRQQKVGEQTKHPVLAKLRPVLILLQATVSIFLILADLPGVQRKHSISNSKGMDPIHLRQLRAIAENLYTQANRHRENHNYLVAHALYGRAFCVAQEIHTPENDGNFLVTRIRTDQQAVLEWCGESSIGEGA
jgi:hypothetical protein